MEKVNKARAPTPEEKPEPVESNYKPYYCYKPG